MESSTRPQPQPLFSPPPPTSSPNLFVFGLGFVGLPFAQALRKRGWKVSGLTFTLASAAAANQHQVPALHTQQNPAVATFVADRIANATHVLSAVPPDPLGDPILRNYASLLSASRFAWIGYISSTSVYGDHKGAWVDESSPSIRVSEKARRRLAAEHEWRRLADSCGIALSVLRLAGIYGAGRSALDTLRRNPRVLDETSDTLDMIVSRVHVHDIVAALVAAAVQHTEKQRDKGKECTIINIADDLPASRREVFTRAEELLRNAGRLERPVGRNTGGRLQSSRNRDRGNKRVSNARMKRLLLPSLSFPTYREGLQAISRDVL